LQIQEYNPKTKRRNLMLHMLALIFFGYYGTAALRGFITALSLENNSRVATWARRHPYHYFLAKDAEEGNGNITWWGFFGGLLAFVSWIAPILILKANLALLPFYIGGIGIYFSVAIGYWLNERGTLWKWRKEIQKMIVKWKTSISPVEIQEAKAILESIHKVIKGKVKSKSIKAIMAKADKLIQEELPRLLNLRQELTMLIDNAKQIIKKEKDNGIIEGEELLMQESEKGLETLNKRLSDVSKKIHLIPTVLNHLCIQLSVIISSDSTSEVQGIIDDVKMDLDIMLESHEEIEHLEAKYLAAQEAARHQLLDSNRQAMEEIFSKKEERTKVAEA